jgi:hypothetical protein
MTAVPTPEPVIERLVRIETKLDISNTTNHERVSLEDARHNDHETRIRRLERSWWMLAGAAATGGGLVGSLLGPLIGGN